MRLRKTPIYGILVWSTFACLVCITIFMFFFGVRKINATAKDYSVESVPLEVQFDVISTGRVGVSGGLIEVASNVEGTISSVMVDVGDRVMEGDLLALQNAGGQKIELDNAKTNLKGAFLSLEESKLSLKIAERELERMRIQQEQDAVTVAELDRARDSLQRAEIGYRRAEASVSDANSVLNKARFNVSEREIRAPSSGVILEVLARPGQVSSVREKSTAFVLLPDRPIEIEVTLGEKDLSLVSIGQKVAISSRSKPDEDFDGEVKRIGASFETPKGKTQASSGVKVVVTAESLPFLIGQPVLVKFKRKN